MPRYRFGEFILSPRRRLLLRRDREQPLIPRYFDLLVFLIEHRHEAVHRQEIFDKVWKDVIVSDAALSQAIRTIRRALGDDSRQPRFIRTVSRHGYRFVLNDVVEEADDNEWPSAAATDTPLQAGADQSVADPFEPLLERIARIARDRTDEEDQREAAELLHTLGTAEALRRLDSRPGHAWARALLRDTRWDVAGAGSVPIAGQPAAFTTAAALVRLRLRRGARLAAARWAGAATGGSIAGVIGGAIGGVLLSIAPESSAPLSVVPMLAIIGAWCGAVGGAGVGAGLSLSEAVARSQRTLALVAGGAVGGAIAGSAVQWLGRWTLASLVGVHVAIGGGVEGLVLGAAAGFGYAIATAQLKGGLAAPRGGLRLTTAGVTALACGVGALVLSLSGRPLVGGTIHLIAQATQGSQAILTPLGHLIGEPDFGPVTRALIGTGEGALFGLGLAFGLTRRP